MLAQSDFQEGRPYLDFKPVFGRQHLLNQLTYEALNKYGLMSVTKVAEIPPEEADGKVLCDTYGLPYDCGANCVVVEAVKGKSRTFAVCLVPVNTRMDLNKHVRKILSVRRVSLAPKNEVLEKSQMEYGSITPIGLDPEWPLLIDEKLIKAPTLIMGGGKVCAKISLPGHVLTTLPHSRVITDLGMPIL